MDEVIVDVRTGEVRIRTFSAGEEKQRLAEIEAALERERVERIMQIKGRLLGLVANLESAKALQGEGVLLAEDVAEVERRIDLLKAELRAVS